MTSKLFSRSILSLAVTGVLAYSGPTQAGGFQITEVCAKCQGVRNAGMSASSVDGAGALYFNPASLSRLTGGDVDANLHYISPSFQFTNKGSTNAFGHSPPPLSNFAAPATGDNHDDAGESAWVPTFFYGQQINDQWAAGIGVNTPYGLATDYSNNWVGRYNALETNLMTVNINPAVSYRFNEQFAIGAGFNAMKADAKLTNAVDFGTLAFLGSRGLIGTPSTQQYDGKQKLTGNSWGYGWNVGILFEPRPGTRFGIAYRSKVNTTLDGDVKIRGNDTLSQLPAPLNAPFVSRKLGASVNLNLPATLMLGAYHEITDRWAVMVGTTWTNWSDFQEIRVKFEHGAVPDAVQPENWQDTWRTAIGTSYKVDDHWTLRGGFEYDPTPVQAKYRTPRIPDADRYWFVVGTGYEYSQALSFDFAYTYLFTPSYKINDTEVTTGELANVPIGNTVKGKYETDTHIVSAQVTWKF
jgi:long-chain fatty acid transport protein